MLSTYNLDAKLEDYDEKFKWIHERIVELLHNKQKVPDYIGPIKDELKLLYKYIQIKDNNLENSINSTSQQLGDNITKLTSDLESTNNKLEESVKKLENDILSAQIGGNTGLVSSLQMLYDELKKYHDSDTQRFATMVDLTKTYDYVSSNILSLQKLANDNVNRISSVHTKLNDLRIKVSSNESDINTKIDILQHTIDNHDNMIGTSIGNISGRVDILDKKITSLTSDIDQKIEDSKNEITSSIEATKNKLTTQVDNLDKKFDSELEKTITTINSIQSDLDKEITTHVANLDTKIQTTRNQLAEQVTSIRNQLQDKINESKDNLEQKITTQIDSTKQELLNDINTTQSNLQSNINQIDTKVTNIQPLIVTQSQIQQMIETSQRLLLEKLYPIGSLYFSIDRNLMDPNTVLGTTFTWELLPAGYKIRSWPGNAGEHGGTDTVDINHNHRIDFRIGVNYQNLSLESNTNAGLATGYDSNNNPTGWGKWNRDVFPTNILFNNHVTKSTGSSSAAWDRSQGVTGWSSKQSIDVSGRVYNAKIWKRTQ